MTDFPEPGTMAEDSPVITEPGFEIIEGILDALECADDIEHLYLHGPEPGLSVGFSALNPFYTVKKGQWTAVTGIPGSGKSTVVDSMMVNLSETHGWKHLICSPENQPVSRHIAALAGVHARKTFHRDYMSEEAYMASLKFIQDHFRFIHPPEEHFTPAYVLEMGKVVEAQGFNFDGFVIDPWNEMEHRRPQAFSETEYISYALSKFRRYVRDYNKHLWVIAHPVKQRKLEIKASTVEDTAKPQFPVVSLYDISGCHDKETEVLTFNGWKLHKDLEKDDLVACFDKETETLHYALPTEWHVYPYSGPMFHFEGKSMDILVTPNHKMVVKRYWGLKENKIKLGSPVRYKNKNWNFIEAKDLSKGSRLLLPKAFPFLHSDTLGNIVPLDNGYDTECLFSLIGWYVTEGWETEGSIAICQAEDAAEPLKSLIRKMGLSCKEAVTTNPKKQEKPIYHFRVYARKHPQLARFLIDNCGKGFINKKLPSLVWHSSEAQKKVLFDSLIAGDGSTYGENYKFFTCSPQLANDVSRLAIELGYKVTQRKSLSQVEKWSDNYTLYITPNKPTECLQPVNHKKKEYEGLVYCLTVPTGAYLTRRNGNMAITGNSAHWFNKCDNGLSIWRDKYSHDNQSTIHVLKIRFRECGGLGQAVVRFDWQTGRIEDL